MDHGHDWHLFDVERDLEVSRDDGGWWCVRKVETPDVLDRLTDEEFDQLRSAGPSPRGLD